MGGVPFSGKMGCSVNWPPPPIITILRVPYDEVSGEISLAHTVNMSRAEVGREKAGVKRELQLYDSVFFGRLGRLPAKEEKEVMGPLYRYYKYLRLFLSGAPKKQERFPQIMKDNCWVV